METDQESRLRRFLAAYERLCKKYGLIVQRYSVFERITPFGNDDLPYHMDKLQKGGINK